MQTIPWRQSWRMQRLEYGCIIGETKCERHVELLQIKFKVPNPKFKEIKIRKELFKEVLGTSDNKQVEPIKTPELLMLSVNTTITVGTVQKISGNIVDLSLNIPIVALKGENLGIARNIDGHWRLIGWGEILN